MICMIIWRKLGVPCDHLTVWEKWAMTLLYEDTVGSLRKLNIETGPF